MVLIFLPPCVNVILHIDAHTYAVETKKLRNKDTFPPTDSPGPLKGEKGEKREKAKKKSQELKCSDWKSEADLSSARKKRKEEPKDRYWG